jgi:hypothetical protein
MSPLLIIAVVVIGYMIKVNAFGKKVIGNRGGNVESK